MRRVLKFQFPGSTNRKELLSWRYNTNCSYCVQCSPSLAHIETITYSEYLQSLLSQAILSSLSFLSFSLPWSLPPSSPFSPFSQQGSNPNLHWQLQWWGLEVGETTAQCLCLQVIHHYLRAQPKPVLAIIRYFVDHYHEHVHVCKSI